MSMIAPRPAPFDTHASARLAVVTSYFNACGYQAPRRNYDRFAAALDPRVPLFTAELAFDDAPFVLPRHRRLQQFRTNQILWHKERLLNLLVQRVPREYDKIAWIDADLIFQNPDWAVEAARLLDDYPVVQLFERAVYRDQNQNPVLVRDGVVAGLANTGRFDIGNHHPGFAWAARRSILERHRLCDFNVVGGGDSVMACAMYGQWQHPYLNHYQPTMRRAFIRWGEPFWQEIRGRVGVVPGDVHHLWHGERRNRKYIERLQWLAESNFDPTRHLGEDSQGLQTWQPGMERLQERLRVYFWDRREDGDTALPAPVSPTSRSSFHQSSI